MLITVAPWHTHQFDCPIRQAGFLAPPSPQKESWGPGRKGTGMAINKAVSLTNDLNIAEWRVHPGNRTIYQRRGP